MGEETIILDNPLTDEQWDMIADVDFDNTEEVTFHTKNGKDVVFVKRDASDVRSVKEAEVDGRLLILPCKVGDHVYTAQRGIVSELVVTCIEVYLSNIWIQWKIISGIYGRYRMDGFPAFDIGKTVFLTREEAEAALRGGADNG